VFGPLNGVRTALVIAAALAALVSLVAGYPAAAIVLMLGVAIHGAGWYYLYVTRDRTSPGSSGPALGDHSET
jgi:cobalamin biosynthesis protein CobD/CbiB